MPISLEKINNKGVDIMHAGDMPSYCIRCGKPPEQFITKRTKGGVVFTEFYCHEHYNREIDNVLLVNPNFKPGLNRRSHEKESNHRRS